MNDTPQVHPLIQPRVQANILPRPPHINMDPSTRHPVFFTDRLWKVNGAPPGSSVGPVSEGYVYREPGAPLGRASRVVENGALFGSKL